MVLFDQVQQIHVRVRFTHPTPIYTDFTQYSALNKEEGVFLSFFLHKNSTYVYSYQTHSGLSKEGTPIKMGGN
jgi:hypothetical protein